MKNFFYAFVFELGYSNPPCLAFSGYDSRNCDKTEAILTMRLTATPVFSYLLVISVTAAAETKDDHIFYFPDYKSFQAAIGRFAEHWMPKSPEQEVPQEAKSRVKRQDPRIGDESQIEWIVKSSR